MPHPNLARVALAATLLCAPLAVATQPAATWIEVDGAWTRAVPEVATASVAFMTILNTDRHDHRLIAVRSPAARVVELHDQTMADGVMRMRRVAGVALPSGTEVSFAPGGLHMMLIGLVAPLTTPGQPVQLQLEFEDGSQATILAPVSAVGDSRPKRQ